MKNIRIILTIILLITFYNNANAAQRSAEPVIIQQPQMAVHTDSLAKNVKERGKPWAVVSGITNALATIMLGSSLRSSEGFVNFDRSNFLLSAGFFFTAVVTGLVYLFRKNRDKKLNGWARVSLSVIFVGVIGLLLIYNLIKALSFLFCLITLCFL